jgi:hypothetical protein
MQLYLERSSKCFTTNDTDPLPSSPVAVAIMIEQSRMPLTGAILDHGANIQARRKDLWTPLQLHRGVGIPTLCGSY